LKWINLQVCFGYALESGAQRAAKASSLENLKKMTPCHNVKLQMPQTRLRRHRALVHGLDGQATETHNYAIIWKNIV
jgi:hypothetical protein